MQGLVLVNPGMLVSRVTVVIDKTAYLYQKANDYVVYDLNSVVKRRENKGGKHMKLGPRYSR